MIVYTDPYLKANPLGGPMLRHVMVTRSKESNKKVVEGEGTHLTEQPLSLDRLVPQP